MRKRQAKKICKRLAQRYNQRVDSPSAAWKIETIIRAAKGHMLPGSELDRAVTEYADWRFERLMALGRLICVSIAFFLLPSIAFAQATAVIVGPTEASPGDLVILDASESDCDARTWLLVGSDKSFLQFEDGEKCVFASGASGSYHFVLSTAKCVDSAASVATARHTVTIGGAPEPQPPKPKPEPVNPDPPGPELTGLALRSYDVAMAIDRKPGEASGIAGDLQAIADMRLDAGGTADLTRPVVKKHTPVDTARWDPFRAFFVATMKAATNHIEALEQISRGLLAAETAAHSSRQIPPAGRVSSATLRGTLDAIKADLQEIRGEVGQ